jgi:hypothetical protein
MKNLKNIVFINLLFFLLFTNLLSTEINIVNCPTAEVVDYGTGEISVRIYSYGGVISRFIFAPFNRINFGGSIDIEKFVGYETPEVHDPAFYIKWRVFDGTKFFPAVAVGYDGQGYKFVSNKYSLPAKGLYLVFSQNILAKKMFLDFGVNLTKYDDSSKLLCFTSLRGTIEDVIKLGVEWENINEQKIQQINLLTGLCLSKQINIDFVFIDLGNKNSKIERQVRIKYLYKFF